MRGARFLSAVVLSGLLGVCRARRTYRSRCRRILRRLEDHRKDRCDHRLARFDPRLRSGKTMNSALAVTPAGYRQLGCFKGKPSVGFVYAFDVGNTKDSEFGYRFDAKPGRQIDPRFLSNHRTIVIEEKSRRGAIRCGAHRVKCPPCPNPILDGGTDKSRVSSRRCAGGHRCGVRWLSSLNPLAAGARCRPGRGPAIARSQFPC
jgi:hypothetical protein